MKNLIIRSTAALALLTATQAYAQDFDGFYLGGQIGYTEATTDAFTSLYAGDGDGVTYGAYAGYNHQTPDNFVLGAEVAYKGGRVEHDMGAGPTLLGQEFYTEDYFDLKAKVGYVFAPGSMAYVVGGRSFATAVQDNNPGTSSLELGGYNYGIGFEQLVTSNMSVGVEVINRELDTIPSSNISYDGMDYSLRVGYHF